MRSRFKSGMMAFAALSICVLVVSSVARSACDPDCHMHNEWYVSGLYVQYDLLTCMGSDVLGDDYTGGTCQPTLTPSGQLKSPGRIWLDGLSCPGNPAKAVFLIGPTEEGSFNVKHCDGGSR